MTTGDRQLDALILALVTIIVLACLNERRHTRLQRKRGGR